MARYRLRFLLQEFDLARGPTLIGRSSDCHVTIEDPLVSRQHARIVIEGDQALLHDLGSRNGVKLNGHGINGPTPLRDGDRLRVGTQELVFCRVDTAVNSKNARTTGFLRHCAVCRLPYPQELLSCPTCGATEQLDEATLSGQFGASSQGSWTVQLLVEVLEKALDLSRVADAERILKRAAAQLEQRIEAGDAIDPRQFGALTLAAARVSAESGDATWALWVIRVYCRIEHVPHVALIDRLAELATRHPGELAAPLDLLSAHCGRIARRLTSEETEALARLDQLRASLADPARPSAPSPAPNPPLS